MTRPRTAARLRLAGLVASVALLAVAAPASAEQTITFKVPANVQNLHPEVAKISVGCRLTPTNAYGRTDLPVSNRAFHGVVDVEVKVDDGQSVVAKGYKCELYLFPSGGTGFKPQQTPGGPPQGQAKTGTPFVPVVEGLLPAAGGFRAVPAPRSRRRCP